jgi:two-component system phosphate regulon response regulator PhoB
MQTVTAETKTVLIADDDLWLRDMLSILLSDEGLRPIEASSGPETLHVAGEQHPDVILLDVGLPGKSGLRVLEDLRKRSATRDIPVMLLTGQFNLVETGHAHDAEGAFHKPLDFSAFLNKVREVTRSTT